MSDVYGAGIDQAKLFQTISLAVADTIKEVLEGEQANRIRELQADLYEGNCELEKQQRINRELANGPYVIANSPQMVKDYIDAGAVTDGMVVIIQSKLKEVSDE